MVIKEKETLVKHNLLSFRSKMTQNDISIRGKQLETFISDCNAKAIEGAITTTYSVEQTPSGPLFDIEFLIPVNKDLEQEISDHNIHSSAIGESDLYKWKKEFLLTNAVKLHHVGNPSLLQSSINELNSYLLEHQLTPITSGYNVTIKQPHTPLEMDEAEIDIYVGINPNIL